MPGRRLGWGALSCFGLALAGMLALGLGIHLTGGMTLATPPWLLDGMLLGALLAGCQRPLPLVAAAGVAVAAATLGIRTDTALVQAACTALLLFGGIAMAEAAGWKADQMATPRGLLRGAIAVLVVAPAPPALLAAAAAGFTGSEGAITVLGHRWLTEELGLAIVVPLVVTLARRDLLLLFVPPLLSATLGLLGLYATVAGVVFLQSRLPLGFLIFPPLLLLVGRLGLPGAALGILVTCAIAGLGGALGTGPLAMVPEVSVYARETFLQFLVVVASMMVYPLGAAVAERRRMNQALADQHARLCRNEKLYRLLADNASDIITRVRLDGRCLYVSPSVRDVLGWTPQEMMSPDWQNNVHPDDFAEFLRVRERMGAGDAHVSNTYRYRRKDGSWCWIEARLTLVHGADGGAKEFVANLRDVTRQKEAERALEAAMAGLAEMAATDGLTGVANRRRFDQALDLEWRRALRGDETVAVLLIDADHFKAYNDRYGHQAGDDCLRAIAHAVDGEIRRAHDLAARYGGEEFVVILPNTDAEGALSVAERIRAAIEALDIPHEANADGVVTVSIGAVALRPDIDSQPEALVEGADAALYAAKRNGRNRVELRNVLAGTATVVPLLPHLRRLQAAPSGASR